VGTYGDNYFGGLVGYNEDGTITGSHATGAVIGEWEVGGLVGRHISITSLAVIDTCYATGAVTGDDHVGGLVGYNQEGTITRSYAAAGSVEGESRTAGLVGSQWSSGLSGHYTAMINECYASGAVEGIEGVGGLVAQNSANSLIIYSYATGSVAGIETVGGLVGENMGSIARCYAGGAVTGDDRVGGLTGYNPGGTVTGSYYDRETTGQSDDDGRGMPKTTAEMQDIATFMYWDIVTLNDFNPNALPGDPDFHAWYIDQGDDYPRLWWQYEAPGGGGSGSFNGYGNNFDMSWITMQMLSLRKPEGLVFGSYPSVTLQFVEKGSRDQLAEVREVYGQFLQVFELNKDYLSASEHARQSIELAIAWAAILAREAALAANAGQVFDLDAVISAYQDALNLLAVSGHLLTGYQQAYALEVLKGIAAIITSLGG